MLYSLKLRGKWTQIRSKLPYLLEPGELGEPADLAARVGAVVHVQVQVDEVDEPKVEREEARGVRWHRALRRYGVVDPAGEQRPERLETKIGRKNVNLAPYRPILSANRTRQRPTAVYAHANPAQNGQNGGN